MVFEMFMKQIDLILLKINAFIFLIIYLNLHDFLMTCKTWISYLLILRI